MRKQPIATGEYYHIYNRGVDKRTLFNNTKDLQRFIQSIIQFNQTTAIGSIRDNEKVKNTGTQPLEILKNEPLVAIVAYCINPNHFHFVLRQLVDGGIAKFMLKLQSGYTSYFNLNNSRTGSLFQGPFKSHHLYNDQYFNKIVGYVNNNDSVHNIPEDKKHLVLNSDHEYKNHNFSVVSREEGERVLKIFSGTQGFEKHCKEIISIIREQRGKTSLLEDDNIPTGAESL